MSTGRDLQSLPKAHLHLHLEGAMRPETLVELAAHYAVALPPVGNYDSFSEFSAIYEAVCAVLRTRRRPSSSRPRDSRRCRRFGGGLVGDGGASHAAPGQVHR